MKEWWKLCRFLIVCAGVGLYVYFGPLKAIEIFNFLLIGAFFVVTVCPIAGNLFGEKQ